MKPNKIIRRSLLALAAITLAQTATRAANVAIPLTSGSYNQDAVYALSGDTFHGSIVADWSLYETGVRPGTAMPTNGIISGRNGVSFQMADYTANNMLLLDQTHPGTMTLDLSGQFTTLSFLSLASTAGNNPTANFTLHFSDGTAAAGSFTGSDWSGNGSQVFSAGILNSDLSTYINNGSWGALYQADYTLASGDQTRTLQSISFTSLGKVGVLAISGDGALVPEPASTMLGGLGLLTMLLVRRRKA